VLGSGADQLGDWEHAYTGLWRSALARAAAFGVPLPAAAERDLEAAVAELADPGPFLALTNGDSETHNFLTGPSGGGKLIDFEGAGFRHGLTAATSFAVPGPNWLGVSGPGQIEAFRRALAWTVPEAEDDQRFGFGLASASMVWVMILTGRLKTLDARSPGNDARTQMVALLESGARTAEAHRVLPHLAPGAGPRRPCCVAAGPTPTSTPPPSPLTPGVNGRRENRAVTTMDVPFNHSDSELGRVGRVRGWLPVHFELLGSHVECAPLGCELLIQHGDASRIADRSVIHPDSQWAMYAGDHSGLHAAGIPNQAVRT
jgi:hypothetical protein